MEFVLFEGAPFPEHLLWEVEAKACGDTKMNGIQSLCSGNSLEGVKTMLLRNQPIWNASRGQRQQSFNVQES